MEIIIFLITVVIALLLGCYVFFKPQEIIEIQKQFYLLINWRMEPVSMPKEIRNTKLMGLFLIVFALISCIYYWLRS